MAIRKLFTSSDNLNNTIEVAYDRQRSMVVVAVTGFDESSASNVRLVMHHDDVLALCSELTVYAWKARQDAKLAKQGGGNGAG
jgi:hypothetical protein